MFYIFFSLVGVMIAVGSPTPLIMWLGMEVTTFFFTSFFFSYSGSVSSGWKYFIIQGVSSFFFFLGWVVGELTSSIDHLLVFVSLSVKLGVFPFSGWVLNLSENMSWWSFFLLGSVQKIAPLVILSKLSDEFGQFIMTLAVLSGLSLLSFFFSDSSIRWMMMFSSLFNLTWLVVGASLGLGSLLTYMGIYFLFNLLVIIYLSSEMFDSISSSFKTRSVSWEENLSAIVFFLSLMGIPPMGTFIGKVELTLSLLEESWLLPITLLFFSALIVFFYLKLSYLKGVMSSKLWLDHFSPKSLFSMICVVPIILILWW